MHALLSLIPTWDGGPADQVQRVTLAVIAHEFGEVTTTQDLIARISDSRVGAAKV